MASAKRMLEALDDVQAPEAWRAIETRAPGRFPLEDRSPRRKLLPILVAFALSAAAVFLVVRAFGGASHRPGAGARFNGLYEADALVLQSSSHGPMLCLGVIDDSLPPRCGDVPITNWDWGRVAGEQRSSGSVWGSYHVIGTFDGARFTETRPPRPVPQGNSRGVGPTIETPCPEPAGGWRTPHPVRMTQRDLDAANAFAATQPDFAGDWIDRVGSAGGHGGPGSRLIILNVAFTGDLQRHETQIRKRWGGPLCLVGASRTLEQLKSIQAQASEAARGSGARVLSTDIDVVHDRVLLEVVAIAPTTRARLDARFGQRAVQVSAALHPVP